ncbi:MAG: riboflavin synthase subunit alpha [Bacteroidetes bacterium CG2_30_33_31]|nr:MAG: riboflavin synthase subunit alpha [Bacteroidetes bacterium CG2_30_33_31]
MFTGIIEAMGKVVAVDHDRTNINFTIESDLTQELKVDQSMAHDGVCLTVVKIDKTKNQYVVTAIQETLDKTCLSEWRPNYEVNLERSMSMENRFDGHIVQGHVDQTAVCENITEENGSWRYYFSYDKSKNNITVEKGSISVNGVSLTVVDSEEGMFSVAIIPFTFEHTNFHNIRKGSLINIEFDVFGKYVSRLMEQYFKQKKQD